MLLLEPITINGMTLKNRVVMAPMGVGMSLRSPRGIAYYGERARGGVSAIICGILMVGTLVSDEAWGSAAARENFISDLSTLIKDVHHSGTRIGLQFSHPFCYPGAHAVFSNDGSPVAPSHRVEPNPARHPGLYPGIDLQELTIAEIEEIKGKYVQAAAITREAGFDFVELHGAHGHFASTFFSPIDNHRTDKYGGSLKGRMRFVLETLTEMRQVVGDDFPIFFRMGAEEQDMPGVKLEEAVEFAAEAENAGADVIDVSVSSYSGTHPLPDEPMGTYAYLAEAVKKRVSIPVITVGRINTPEVAEAILHDGKADLVAIGRQLIADPHWVNKVMKGSTEDIIPCISCMHCHGMLYHKQQPLECSVNPLAGKESEFQIRPAEKPKRVFVVGGGPAGMEASIVAAQRGHRVTLFEKSGNLGGQLLHAAIPPHKEPINWFLDYLINQLKKSTVTVRVGTEITTESIVKANPDVVLLAIGAEPLIPDIPGVSGSNVLTALQVLEGKPVMTNVIIVGGGLIGCETALFLAKKDKKVKILEMLDRVGADYDDEVPRVRMLQHLQASGVEVITGAKALEITRNGVVAAHGSTRKTFKVDTVVIAVGMRPKRVLGEQLGGKVKALYSIGDCAELGRIAGAIHSGAQVASEL